MVKLNFPQQILTERLSIQRLRYEDAEEIFFTYASKPEVTRFLSWPTHRSLADTKTFLKYADASWRNGSDYSFSIRQQDSSRLVGGFGVQNENGRIQIGYVYSPVQWGRGYATEVCTAMIEHIRQQNGVYRIQSFVDIENSASASVLKKSGFIEEARLSKWFRFVNQNNEARDCIHFHFPL